MIRTVGPFMSKPVVGSGPQTNQGVKSGFEETLKRFIADVDTQIKHADSMMQEFAVGKRADLHSVMIETEKADLSLKLLLRIRNKLVEAYQEIMRMQV